VYRVEVDPSDIREITEMLPRFCREWVEAMVKITDLAVENVKANAPVSSGRTRDSFGAEVKVTPEGVEGWVYSDWFIARLQNYGYAGHWYKFSDGPFVWIPGKPKKEDGYFVEPAIEEVLRQLDHQIDEVVRKI
jgi:hypothetical protein